MSKELYEIASDAVAKVEDWAMINISHYKNKLDEIESLKAENTELKAQSEDKNSARKLHKALVKQDYKHNGELIRELLDENAELKKGIDSVSKDLAYYKHCNVELKAELESTEKDLDYFRTALMETYKAPVAETYHDHGGNKSTVINPITKEPLFDIVDGIRKPTSVSKAVSEEYHVNGKPVTKEAYEAREKEITRILNSQKFKDVMKFNSRSFF